MGVIKSQSIYSTLFSYVGVIVGFVSSALIMPQILTAGQLGFMKLLAAVLALFSMIFSLGVGQMLFRSFPNFEDDISKRRRLLWVSIQVAIIGSILSLPVFLLTYNELFNFDTLTKGIDKDIQLLIFVFAAIVARIFYNSIFSYVRMMNNVVVDAFIQNIYQKTGVLILLILFYFDVIGFSGLIYLNIWIYLLFPIILTVYFALRPNVITIKNALDLQKKKSTFSTPERKEFVRLLMFGLLTTLGGSLYLYLDTLMVNFYLSEVEVGIYGTMFLFGVIVIVPARSLKSISVSVLAKSFKQNDFDNILDIYKKSSITLLIIGGYIFMGVWCNLFSVFAFLPEEYKLGYYVMLYIGIVQLFDMATGVNNEIIAVSKHYKLNTLFTVMSIVIGVLANMVLIPMYGIDGAGIATLIAIVSVNLLKLIAVYRIYKIHPFSNQTIKIVLVITLLTLSIGLIPNLDNYILNLFMKGGIITIVYLPVVYFLNISSDFNETLSKLLTKFLWIQKK